MSFIAIVFYALTVLLFIFYFFLKFVNRKYLFSIFNISFLIYCFSIFISPIFYNSPQAWVALFVTDYKVFSTYLDECLIINCTGLIFTLCTLSVVEFNRNSRVCATISKWSGKISDNVLKQFFYICVFFWYAIVLLFNKGLPLFNGGRGFYYNTAISPIYQALNEILFIYSVYFGCRLVYFKKDALKFIIAVLTLLFTGNRGTVLVSVLVPIGLLFIYGMGINKNSRKKHRGKFLKICLLLLSVGAFGLVLQFVRSGGEFSIKGLFEEVLYGNTFSDIRDGAFILKGYREKFGTSYLGGKTYLAGILSFIPSSFFPYREMWSWGRFTANGLFGWENHFGLRGGAVMEAYLNFGWVGVLVFGTMQGVVYASLEKVFYYNFYSNRIEHSVKELPFALVLAATNNLFVCTSGLYNIYVDLIFLILIILLSGVKFKYPKSGKRPLFEN